MAARDVLKEMRGIDQRGALVWQWQAGEQVGTLHCWIGGAVVEVDPAVSGDEDAAAGEVDLGR